MNNTIFILMRNDDPCSRSDPIKEKKVLKLFEQYYVPQVLAVIPNNVEDPHVWHSGKYKLLEENPEMIKLLNEYQDKGLVEVAQHGDTHQTNYLHPSIKDELTKDNFHPGIDRDWTHFQPEHSDGYSEFSGLPKDKQEEKVIRGRKYLEKIFQRKFDSFIFPWNTYDKVTLKALKKNGYKFVPGEDDVYVNPDVCVIGCCNWDWEIDRFRELMKEIDSLGKPVLTQFAYHSWFISDEFMEDLNKLLTELTLRDNAVFITPNQIDELVPWAPRIIKLRSFLLKLERSVSKCVNEDIRPLKYYVKDYGYYLNLICRYVFALFLLKVCGLRMTIVGTNIIRDYLLKLNKKKESAQNDNEE